MRRRLCCAYNVSRGRAEIGRLEAMQAVACRGRVGVAASGILDINRRLNGMISHNWHFMDLGYNMQD